MADKVKKDLSSYVWKFPKDENGEQDEIRMIDATDEQLVQFYETCNNMLYNKDKINPGRHIIYDRLNEEIKNCNVELFLRQLENGSITEDHRPYPRYLCLQDLRNHISRNEELYKEGNENVPIYVCMNNLPREYERITVADVIRGCLGELGIVNMKPLTFNFIINMGVYFTQAELKTLREQKTKLAKETITDVVKYELDLKDDVKLNVRPSGLTYSELRAMLNFRSNRIVDMTTEQLFLLSRKMLFRLQAEIKNHISQWELIISQIEDIAKERNIQLNNDKG